jgi:hypothetical protein
MVVHEVRVISHTHTYNLSIKMMTAATIAVIIVMAGLYSLLGLPPSPGYGRMYFHSVGIGIAALATYSVISIFDLQQYEPPIDFPISYRAFAAVLVAAAGGIFYLNPNLDVNFTYLPLSLYIVAFVLIGDVGGALFIELVTLPRKRARTYKPKAGTTRPRRGPEQVLRMLPQRKDWPLYARAGLGYWLALVAVGSAFIAGMIGFVNLWVRIFGLSLFSGYAAFLGLNSGGILRATLDPHTHEMGLAIMAGTIALVAHQFRVLDFKGLKQNAARIGLGIASIGVVVMTAVFLAVAFFNYSPSTLFASANDVNGMAGDDTVMSFIALGAMITLIPLAMTKLAGKSSWKDCIRLTLLGTWVATVMISVFETFYVEFHEDLFGSTSSPNDTVFSEVQQMFGVFLLVALALILLAVDYYEIGGRLRRYIGWAAGVGLIISTIGALLWPFADPTIGGLPYWMHILGVFVVGVSAFLACGAIYKTRISSISRSDLR